MIGNGLIRTGGVLGRLTRRRLLAAAHYPHPIARPFLFSTTTTASFDYNAVAENALQRLLTRLEASEAKLPRSRFAFFDIEYTQGVLTVKFDPQTTYVLNKQPPNRQIWLSSPFSGPRRFDWSSAKSCWIDTRNKDIELTSFLREELHEKLNFPL